TSGAAVAPCPPTAPGAGRRPSPASRDPHPGEGRPPRATPPRSPADLPRAATRAAGSRGRVRRRAPDESSDRSGSCVVLQYLQQRFARAMHAHLQRRDALAGHSGHLLITPPLHVLQHERLALVRRQPGEGLRDERDRKSTRLNSSHVAISYAVFCLKKKKKREAVRGARAACQRACRVGVSSDTGVGSAVRSP